MRVFTTKTIGLLYAATLALAAEGAAADTYVAAFGGVAAPVDKDFSVNAAAESFESDVGFLIGAAAGRTSDFGLGLNLRLETEFSYRKSDVTQIARLPASGDQAVSAILVNALLEFSPDVLPVRPYIGGGIGVARVDTESMIDAVFIAIAPPPFPLEFDKKDVAFAWQAIGGASLGFSDRLEVFVEGRYFSAPNVNIANFLGGSIKKDYAEFDGLAGVRLRF